MVKVLNLLVTFILPIILIAFLVMGIIILVKGKLYSDEPKDKKLVKICTILGTITFIIWSVCYLYLKFLGLLNYHGVPHLGSFKIILIVAAVFIALATLFTLIKKQKKFLIFLSSLNSILSIILVLFIGSFFVIEFNNQYHLLTEKPTTLNEDDKQILVDLYRAENLGHFHDAYNPFVKKDSEGVYYVEDDTTLWANAFTNAFRNHVNEALRWCNATVELTDSICQILKYTSYFSFFVTDDGTVKSSAIGLEQSIIDYIDKNLTNGSGYIKDARDFSHAMNYSNVLDYRNMMNGSYDRYCDRVREKDSIYNSDMLDEKQNIVSNFYHQLSDFSSDEEDFGSFMKVYENYYNRLLNNLKEDLHSLMPDYIMNYRNISDLLRDLTQKFESLYKEVYYEYGVYDESRDSYISPDKVNEIEVIVKNLDSAFSELIFDAVRALNSHHIAHKIEDNIFSLAYGVQEILRFIYV